MAARVLLATTILSAHALNDGSSAFYEQLLTESTDSNSTAELVTLDLWATTLGAMCLDGSPGAYYFRKGVGSGANKWYIHHQGGGWCESWDDCLQRSTTPKGSSTNYTKTMPLSGGYFDPSPAINPMMYNWNSVMLRYCDGGSFSGNNESVTTYKGQPLYYRGKRIREAAYSSLLSKGLREATDVVISGCSAGGLATFLHTDQWCDALAGDVAGRVKCVGMPDSGFFLDYQDPRFARSGLGYTASGRYHSGLKWVFEAMNTTAGLNQDCVDSKSTGGPVTDDPAYLCQFAEHTSPFTHTPLFPLQSEYDSWQTGNVLYYPNTGADVQVLGDNITRRLRANLLGPHRASGAFLDSCWHHCGMWGQIRIDGELVATAFSKWYDGLDTPASSPQRVYQQGKPYKCDACCKP